MAERDLDIVVRAKGALAAAQQIGKVDSAVGKLGRTAATGVRTAAGNIAKIGVIAGGVIAVGVKQGLDSLAQLESATTSVSAAISQVGLSGQVSAQQVAAWSQQIETNVGSAFDDKAILQASETLIRFGKVTATNLQPAMVVMTDLATKTGSVDSAASLLAKALADPEKAAGKLARSGVVLTKAQQDQIKAFVKAGKTAQAQKVILDALSKTTKGAAAASQGPYARSLATLRDVTEDAERALAEGFLPVIEKVRGILSTELAKPQTLTNIREFGKGLASGLGNLIDIAKGLPWGAIGNALKIGGAGAKAVLDAFTAMPPWVQTAIATGWGLNKLTGGAVSSIIGQLGGGLIKGVLGMNAGVVNINAGVVNGAGGVGGVAAGAAAGAGKLTLLGFLGLAGIGLVIADVLHEMGVDKPIKQFADQYKPGHVQSDANGDAVSKNVGTLRPALLTIGQRAGQTFQAIERARAATLSGTTAVVSAINATTSAVLSLPDRIRIGTQLAHTTRDSQSYASNTTTSGSAYTSGSGVAIGSGHN